MTEVLNDLAGRVVIVGSGLAGLMAALTLAPQPAVILTRAALGAETSSAWAQGGIAASLGADDSAELHLADTLAAGDGLCDPAVAASIVGEAPAAITALERAGVRFDRNGAGTLSLGLEAAHSRRRIVHAEGDGSGAAIVRALVQAVANTPSITVLEGHEARRLLLDGERISGLYARHRREWPFCPPPASCLRPAALAVSSMRRPTPSAISAGESRLPRGQGRFWLTWNLCSFTRRLSIPAAGRWRWSAKPCAAKVPYSSMRKASVS